MKKKLIPLIAIAFVIAAISTAVFYSLFAIHLSGAAPQNSMPKVIVAARDLPPGTVLAVADVDAIAWGGELTPKGAYTTPGKVEGRIVIQPLARGEPVLESRLGATDGTGLGIPEGMRAVSIHASDSSGVVGLLKPGYKVDVQVFGWRSRKTADPEQVKTLLEGAAVLAISTQNEGSSQGYFAAPVVTLVARTADAEHLAVADSFARLRLSLRNPLEPGAASSAAPASAGARLQVKAVALTDEGLSLLASRLNSRFPPNEISFVATPAPMDPETIADLFESGNRSRHQSESIIPASSTQISWFDLPLAGGRSRIGFGPFSGTADMRIRSEITGKWSGRIETHSVETILALHPGSSVVVTGLESAGAPAPDGKFRHQVLLVFPEKKNADKAAR